MKNALLFFLFLFLVLPYLGSVASAEFFSNDLTITVESTSRPQIVTTACTGHGEKRIEKTVDEWGHCRIDVSNAGNTYLDINITSNFGGGEEDWFTWKFECPNPIGDCKDEQGKNPMITDIELEPGEDTHFFLNTSLGLTGKSSVVDLGMVHEDEEEHIDSVTVITEDDPEGRYGPFLAPVYTDISVVFLIVTSSLIAALTKIR